MQTENDRELCMNCGGHGVKTHEAQHSQLMDKGYDCPSCGATWTYIMDGEVPHRFQLEYPKR